MKIGESTKAFLLDQAVIVYKQGSAIESDRTLDDAVNAVLAAYAKIGEVEAVA